MRHMVFGTTGSRYKIALFTRYLRDRELRNYLGDLAPDTCAFAITPAPKAKNPELKEFLDQHMPVLIKMQADYLLVTEAPLFKLLTKQMKVSKVAGYMFPCVIEGYEHIKVLYVPSSAQLAFDPGLITKINQGLDAVRTHRAGTYEEPGTNIIHSATYLSSTAEIIEWLNKLQDVDLTCDIEAFSLKHVDAGIGTMSLCWDKHNGIAFPVDYVPIAGAEKAPYGMQVRNEPLRAVLAEWFRKRTAKTIYHGVSYDVYVLIYQLFMGNILDTEGLLDGLDVMMRNVEDTLLVTYLATNSCAGNHLGLKDQAQEFAGNYGLDEIKDITQIRLPDLLQYNLVDGLCTWYVAEKNWPIMVRDDQREIYETLLKPGLTDIIQMQLTGLPVDMAAVKAGKAMMEKDRNQAIYAVSASPYVKQYEKLANEEWVIKRNQELKVKRVTIDDAKESFNFNSPNQIQRLLHEVMSLPVLSRTRTGQPETGMDALKELLHHCEYPDQTVVLEKMIEFKQVDKILTSFIPAFEAAFLAHDGHYYLFGFFNLGGTLSGRLSSNNPNLQNIPASGTKYAKAVKLMFKAPRGWLFAGLDFASLEDRISALTTKDPNKLKVYTDGYDGHSLRAFTYFGDQMPDIVDTVASINSIEKKYKPLRQESKAPTFALTYQGTYRTLMTNCGFDEAKAKMIEAKYHELYAVSDKWVADRLLMAQQTGFVTVAFGLRLRTPMLGQAVLGLKDTPKEAAAEGRTAGNAMGQSYGLLNTRAHMAFMRKVRKSKWRLEIKPCAQIHDAGYYLTVNDADLLEWMNRELVAEVQWQELPEIQHDDVKLGGELSLFYPTWAQELSIPNGADADQILTLAKEHLAP